MRTFTVKSDLLFEEGKKVSNASTSKTSGKFKSGNLKFIVVHYTAGMNFDADVKTLSSSKDVQASCQLVVSPEGKVVQIGSLQDVEWHAGRSSWRGFQNLNSFSIGIECTNPGWVEFAYEKEGIKYYKFPGGKVGWNDKDNVIIEAKHPNGGPVRYWVQFSEAQLEALDGIIRALMAAYPSIREVVGHDMIAPDRKIDPGPCLPDGFYAKYNQVAAETNQKTLVIFNTKGSGANVRTGPGMEFPRVVLLQDGSKVTELERLPLWVKIRTERGDGWTHRDYLKVL